MELSAYVNLSFSNTSDDFELAENSHVKFIEETDLNTSDDSTTVSRIHDKNKICPLCSYVYKSEEDFVAHSAMHYSRPLSSSSASSSSGASASLPDSPNSVDIGTYFLFATILHTLPKYVTVPL